MADHFIAARDQGVYELDILAGETLTIEVEPPINQSALRVIVHDSDAPVYVKRGTTVTAKDPAADMIPDLSWLDVTTAPAGNTTIAIVSTADAVVSVARR